MLYREVINGLSEGLVIRKTPLITQLKRKLLRRLVKSHEINVVKCSYTMRKGRFVRKTLTEMILIHLRVNSLGA